jgi:hypothetical protein
MKTRDETPIDHDEDTLADDLLNGVGQIANFLGLTERQTYYLLSAKKIPATKELIGWTSLKSRLRRHVEGLVDSGRVASPERETRLNNSQTSLSIAVVSFTGNRHRLMAN